MNRVHTILIGGKAGEGVKKAAQVIAVQLMKHGLFVFQQDDYQSLIRGGHNFSVVSFSASPVFCAYSKANLIISFDQRSLETHIHDLADPLPDLASYHCYNQDDGLGNDRTLDASYISLPFTTIMKQMYLKLGNVSLAAIALVFAWFDWDEDRLDKVIRSEFRRDIEENCRFASNILRLSQQTALHTQAKGLVSNPVSSPQRFLSGNHAISLGAWAAGLDFYYGYPMTPASSLLHYFASKQTTYNIYAIHAESELAAANMAIGSALAGAKSAVGSSGGGFSLMQEAFSLCGMAEVPLLFILASRPGPATGVSTYTAQEDLFFALHQGHGEFGRVVAVPDSPDSAFRISAELLRLAWEFQSPVILLSDKHLSESSLNSSLPIDDLQDAKAVIATTEAEYARYSYTEDGVSPLLFPGSEHVSEQAVIKWSSHEHLPTGLRTDKAIPIMEMKDKRNRKTKALYEATKRYQRIAIYGDDGIPIFAYGSTVLELREAQKHCSSPFRIVSLLYLHPFPMSELVSYTKEEIIVVEHSSTGNLASYLQQQMQVPIKRSILRYDGRPFDPIELALILEEAIYA